MGKALVLKNVDFSDVAVDQVTIAVEKPCTAITLNTSTLVFQTVEETSQLTAALTPSDTTDTVAWTSSNENVATVSTTGLVTIHGIGTATITATCGEQTATASIIQTTIKPQYGTKKLADHALGKDGSIIKISSSAELNSLGEAYDESHVDLAVRYGYGVNAQFELIRVPYGATKACVSTTNNVAVDMSYGYVADTTELITVSNKQHPAWVSNVSHVDSSSGLAVEYGQCVGFTVTDAQLATLDYVYFK